MAPEAMSTRESPGPWADVYSFGLRIQYYNLLYYTILYYNILYYTIIYYDVL